MMSACDVSLQVPGQQDAPISVIEPQRDGMSVLVFALVAEIAQGRLAAHRHLDGSQYANRHRGVRVGVGESREELRGVGQPRDRRWGAGGGFRRHHRLDELLPVAADVEVADGSVDDPVFGAGPILQQHDEVLLARRLLLGPQLVGAGLLRTQAGVVERLDGGRDGV